MKTLHENPWFRVLHEAPYYWVDEPKAANGAVIIALCEQQLVLVESIRPLHGGLLLEAPRGYGEAGETSRDCACRELAEETGFHASPEQLLHLGQVRPNSAMLSSCVDVWLAQVSAVDQHSSHDDEVQSVRLLPLAELLPLLASGAISDGFTLSAIALYLAHREGTAT